MFSALAANFIERSILLSIRFMVVNTIRFSTKVKCCKGNTEALHPSKKVYNLYTNICPLPVIPLVKECERFYCHLTLFVRNRLIYRDFKSVRWFQSILHTPAHILHTTPSCLAVGFVVCAGPYIIGTQKNLSEQQTSLLPYAVTSPSRACAVWQCVGCVGCV